MDAATYLLLADAVLLLHAAIVLFIVAGLILIWIGAWRGWHWVRNFWFRIAHIVAIVIVVLQAWLGALCPLTNLEMYLRREGGGSIYSESFIGHWAGELLYYDAPFWVFTVMYSAFAGVVIVSWFLVRPLTSDKNY